MPIVSAENNFKRGLEALVDQNFVEAAMLFRRAMDIEHQRHVLHPDMRYLSYYGMCRARAHGHVDQGLHACKRAVALRSRDPEMFLNLGRVHLIARNNTAALDVFKSGLVLDPMHGVLLQEARRLKDRLPERKNSGARREGFLSRLRAAWTRPAASPR